MSVIVGGIRNNITCIK